jgi:metal transporter CNNM
VAFGVSIAALFFKLIISGWLFAACHFFHMAANPQDSVSLPMYEVALRILASVVLLAFSALFSGLTLGVMGLETTGLKIIMESGEPDDRVRAQRIMTVRKDGNLLLCTLLLGNVAVNSLMSILTAELTSGFVGFALSTILIVLGGEIIPQAACSRHGLSVGSKFVPVVRVIIVLFYPFAKPVALVLDWWLGEEIGTYFSRSELQSLVRLHASQQVLEPGEAAVMSGALSFRNKKVREVMTPIQQVFAVCSSDRLDYATIAAIFRTGFSRIPVWADDRRTEIVGMLYAKDLMVCGGATAGLTVC